VPGEQWGSPLKNILMTEKNIRFQMPEETYRKVLKVQGLLSFKEGKKVKIQDVYSRLIERGAIEILRQNK
jgi:hypothetical protein